MGISGADGVNSLCRDGGNIVGAAALFQTKASLFSKGDDDRIAGFGQKNPRGPLYGCFTISRFRFFRAFAAERKRFRFIDVQHRMSA